MSAEKERGNGPFMDVELRGLSASLPNDGVLNAALFQCLLSCSTNAGFEAQCVIRNAGLRMPLAKLKAQGLDAELAFAWSEQAGLQSAAGRSKTIPDRIRSVNIRGVELGEIPLQIATDGKTARVAAAINPPGSALSATVALSASFATKALVVSATVPPAAMAENDPLLAPFLPASLKSATFSGRAGGRPN